MVEKNELHKQNSKLADFYSKIVDTDDCSNFFWNLQKPLAMLTLTVSLAIQIQNHELSVENTITQRFQKQILLKH